MKHLLTAAFVFLVVAVTAQGRKGLVAGPMLGQIDYRVAKVWAELEPGAKAQLKFWRKGEQAKQATALSQIAGDAVVQGSNIVHFTLPGLEVNTSYEYQLMVNNTAVATGSFTTKELWQWRKPVPDFSFLTGSCSYMNQPPYDRPGRPYGGDSSIYTTMAKEEASFMMWLGDNWYTREVDYTSAWGLWNRAQYDRSRPILQDFWKKMPHYAIWDDHDFGPNDYGAEYVLKEESRRVFMSYWANPSYGENGQGIYTKISHGDVDIFMLDDRTWRSADNWDDSVAGKPNSEKKMFGDKQMQWLREALVGSSATFKIIATGSQVLNPRSPFDCFRRFPAEYHPFMQFLREEKISGVVFLTGDRHHSEVIKVEGLTDYPMYDITVSPLTSGTHVFGSDEKDNPFRVIGIDQKQNYGRISIAGKARDRRLTVRFLGVKGEALGEWSVHENELKKQK